MQVSTLLLMNTKSNARHQQLQLILMGFVKRQNIKDRRGLESTQQYKLTLLARKTSTLHTPSPRVLRLAHHPCTNYQESHEKHSQVLRTTSERIHLR